MLANKTSSAMHDQTRMVESIPVQWIRPNPYQPRRSFSEASIDELARSIRRYGLM